MVPLAPLAEFAAHKQQFLAGVHPHEAQVGPQVGEFLPAVTGHFVDQRMFAVHHLVMGNGQDEPLGPRVHQAEAQLVMVMGAVHRVLLDVMQRVVHPAHVPFVTEPQAALPGGLAHARPGGGFLGDHQRAGRFQGDHVIEVAQKVDSLQVLAPAMTVGHPLAGLARIVAVKHRGHRIHPQAVDMKVFEPVQRRGQHEAVHLGAAQVVDQRVPVLVKPFQRVAVFIQRGAVELRQAVGVGGKMRRHPVEDHADTGLVAGIDEKCKVVRRTKPRAGRELRQRLIPPRAAERVLHDRHQFNVGEAQLLHIRDQPLGQFAPVVLARHLTRLVQLALPGTGVQFVDRQRCVDVLPLATGLHPVLVLPVHLQRRGHSGSGVGRQLGGQRYRVGLERQDTVGAEQFVLVGRARLQVRDKQLPHTGRMTQTHGVPAAVPHVEIAHHRHSPGVRRPHGKTHAVDTVHTGDLRTKATAEVAVVALGKQVQVHLTEQRAKTVGIFGDLLTTGPLNLQPVSLLLAKAAHKQTRYGACRQHTQRFVTFTGQHLDAQGTRQKHTNKLPALPVIMRPQNGERVRVFGPHQRVNVLG
ncbi:MAG: hypothetical protein GAK37_01794 [Pseudomonas sp.]|nr:MAG: hypothetical protein GAK37_01794 [Pseudomonas sp.]